VQIRVFEEKKSLSHAAAEQAASAISRAMQESGWAHIAVATGVSQFEFLEALTHIPNLDSSEHHRVVRQRFRRTLKRRRYDDEIGPGRVAAS
jgi:6-phosphogluconolactonase/glucosamine-6-phosphate isomerase/deaminase